MIIAQAERRLRSCARARDLSDLAIVKRLAWLLPIAFVLMWGGVLLETGRPATASRDEPAQEQAIPEAAPVVAQDAVPTPPEAEPELPAAPPPTPAHSVAVRESAVKAAPVRDFRPMGPPERVRALLAQSAPPTRKDQAEGEAKATPDEELLGEHGVGASSPGFVQLETDYQSEPRDGGWALAEETRLGQLIQKHPISRQLALLNCQESVCRIMLETKSKDAFEQLLSVPGLAEATGLSSSSPFSLRSGQLSVYYRRAEPGEARR